MANEIQARISMSVRNGNLNYAPSVGGFAADQAVVGGPSPGQLLATITGINIDLSELDSPGMCRIMNLDTVNFVTVGIWDSSTSKFYPLMDLLSGEFYILRLSRYLGEQISGTGTLAGDATALRIKADTASCKVLVEAFES